MTSRTLVFAAALFVLASSGFVALASGCGGGGTSEAQQAAPTSTTEAGESAATTTTEAGESPAGGFGSEGKSAPAEKAARSASPSGETPPGGRPEGAGPPQSKSASQGQKGKPIPGHYIVTVKARENPRSVAAIAKVTPQYVYENALNGFAAELNDGQLNALRQNKAVAAIEQDQEVSGSGYYYQTMDSAGQPWGLDRIDQRSGLSRTYTWWSSGSVGAGYGIYAYIIDSGIATANADFGGRARNVYDAFGGNGQDCNGHGTHVAGTVGGATYGVAKSVQLRGVRVLGCNNSGSTAGVIAGVDWVRKYGLRPAVVNMSLGASYSLAENTAVTNLINAGFFVAVAAGNGDKYGSPLDACTQSPASAAGTVTVASANSSDTKASDSNYGQCVDLYGPGVSIKSTWLNGGTNTISGTSMATPHVTGVAALLKSDYGDQTAATIAFWILNVTTNGVIKSNVSGTPNRLLYMSGW